METKIIQNKNSHIVLNVKISDRKMAGYFEDVYRHLAPSVNMPGFRPGKAPRAMIIEAIGRQRLGNLAMENAIKQGLITGFKEHKLEPIGRPAISVVVYPNFSDGSPMAFEFNAEFDILPQVKFVRKYTGIELTPAPKDYDKVTQEDIAKLIGELARRKAQFKPLGRAARKGDRIEISFTGYDGRIPIEQLTSRHHPIILGQNALVPGFEEHLLGARKGDKKTFSITFPKDYYAKQFGGKKYRFEVEVERVDEVQLPKIDDALAQSYGAKNLQELKDLLERNLRLEKRSLHKAKNEDEVVQYIYKIARTDLPATLVESERQRLIQNIDALLEQKKSTMEEYLQMLGTNKERFEEDITRQASKNVLIGLALRQVAKNENIELKKEDSLTKVVDWLIQKSRKARSKGVN